MMQPHPTTPEHRAKILSALGEIWARCPHLRLGQLIANVFDEHYHVTDTTLVDLLAAYYHELETP